MDFLVQHTQIFPSKSEAKKMLQGNGFAINKEKFTDVDGVVNATYLLHNRYLIAQKGKKQYFMIEVVA
jgi:tyrosyl-tRNA synthetase